MDDTPLIYTCIQLQYMYYYILCVCVGACVFTILIEAKTEYISRERVGVGQLPRPTKLRREKTLNVSTVMVID